MKNVRQIAILCLSVVLVLGLVSPALGGPSIASIGKTAKKALRTANQAKGSAGKANSAATLAGDDAATALSTANTANGKADQALARPVVTLSGITVARATVAIPPNDSNVAAAVCPAGQRVVSGGAATTSPQGGNWLSVASEDRRAWLAGGEDLSGSGGEVTAEAYCASTGQAVASTVDRASIRRELHRWELRKAHASKTCSSGYVHANLSWGEKCLRAGQYCKRGKNGEYHRYGFHCKANGHLRRR